MLTKILNSWLLLVLPLIFEANAAADDYPLYHCVENGKIVPCGCVLETDNENDDLSVYCTGKVVTQKILNNFFTALKKSSNLTSPAINGAAITIAATEMETIDLMPLAGSNISAIEILSNTKLSSFVPLSSSSSVQKISKNFASNNFENVQKTRKSEESIFRKLVVESIIVENSSLTNAGVTNLLSFLEPHDLVDLFLEHGKLEGSIIQGPIIPGLPDFSQLVHLSLAHNELTTIGGGPFRQNGRLEFLDLSFNKLSRIGADAFLFDPIDLTQTADILNETAPTTTQPLRIILDGNKINETTFSGQTGLDTIVGRPVTLSVRGNQFGSLPDTIFKRFLDTHKRNELLAERNPIICDQKLDWILKDREQGYGHRVVGSCVNFGGKTIFNLTNTNYLV